MKSINNELINKGKLELHNIGGSPALYVYVNIKYYVYCNRVGAKDMRVSTGTDE